VRILPENEVHIYSVGTELEDVAHHDRWRGLLSPEERGRYERFVFERDRRTFLLAHALVRLVLSAYSGVDPADLEFEFNPFGKPLVRPCKGCPCPCFSLSHTTGLAACAIAFEPEIGIDVEDTRRAADCDLLAESSFSLSEQAWLRRFPTATRGEHFYDLWTLKEAYIKARGIGLSLPLNQFSMEISGETSIAIRFSESVDDRPGSWQFALFPALTYRMALAVRKPPNRPWAIRNYPLTGPLIGPLTG